MARDPPGRPKKTPSRVKKAKKPPRLINPHIHKYGTEVVRHFLELPRDQQEDLVRLEDECTVRVGAELEPLRFRVLKHGFCPAVRCRLLRYVDNLANDDRKRREYLETALAVPIGRYRNPFSDAEPKAALSSLSTSLDAAAYGHADAKGAILRVVAQWLRNPEAKGMAIMLCGPPGTSKSSLVQKGVSAALGLPYTFVGLGGASTASSLLGFNFCYEGSHPGAIAQALIRNGSMSQVFLFDEVDKACATDKGSAVVNALIHITDETTNTKFHDRYLGDIDLDMSRSLMFFTCNDADAVSPILRDRMVRIDVGGYSAHEKVEIARRHLLPEALKEFGLQGSDVSVVMSEDMFIRRAVTATSSEKGVRDLKRAFRGVCSEINLRRTFDPDAAFGRDALDAMLRKETASKAPECHNSMYN